MSEKENLINKLVGLYQKQLNSYVTDNIIMKPIYSQIDNLNEKIGKEPADEISGIVKSDEGAEMVRKLDRLDKKAESLTDDLTTKKKQSIKRVQLEMTRIVNDAYNEASQAGKVDVDAVKAGSIKIVKGEIKLLEASILKNFLGSKNFSEHTGEPVEGYINDPVIAKHRSTVYKACANVFKGYCTLLYTVLDFKSALGFGRQGSDGIVKRLKDNFNNVNLALTTSQKKIQESVKALNHGTSRTATMFQKEVAKVVLNPNNHRVLSHKP